MREPYLGGPTLNRPLRDLDEEAFDALANTAYGSGPLLAEIVKECTARGLLSGELSDRLFMRLVRAWLARAYSDFAKLRKHGPDDVPDEGLFALFATDFLCELDAASVRAVLEKFEAENPTEEESKDPDWPWPITEPKPSSGGSFAAHFELDRSGLRMCGYRVGHRGLPASERKDFLDRFYRTRLPAIVEQYCGSDYGGVGSSVRLQKMAIVIASNCKNFKRNDRERYQKAISDYETDLAYLKQEYYHPNSFPWPSID
jgi:hypothetical protein